MSNTLTSTKPLVQSHQRVVNVAVAVIYYQDQYLLGYRNSEQHQGDRYEFVGGKIDAKETAVAALIRETEEETGIDISGNVAVKLGRLHHDYGDKQVCLQVYKVVLTAEQYQHYKHYDRGLEGQALTWVDKQALVNNHYSLPAANQTILTWLKLPESITITHPLAHFEKDQQQARDGDVESIRYSAESWLQYHQQQLATESCCYLRLKVAELNDEQRFVIKSIAEEGKIAQQLLASRPDINAIVAYKVRHKIASKTPQTDSLNELSINQNSNSALAENNSQIFAYHLTQTELMAWFHHYQQQQKDGFKPFVGADDLSLNLLKPSSDAMTGLVISCHDIASITAANQLAHLRLLHGLAPVIAIFLSPVMATKTHPDSPALGWQRWSVLAQLADMPVIALGGLTSTMTAIAAQHGASSLAGIRGFLKG